MGAEQDRAALQAARTRIEDTIRGRTLLSALAGTAAGVGDHPAMTWRTAERWRDPSPGGWQTVGWLEYREQVRVVHRALRRLGLAAGDFALMIARNHPAHFLADHAVMHALAIPVSLYPTLAGEQLRAVAGRCRARLAIVEGPELLERVLEVPSIERVVAVDAQADDARVTPWEELQDVGGAPPPGARDPFDEAVAVVRPEDPATVFFTSGTTGPPKGVMVSHRMALWIEASLRILAGLGPGDRLVSYLPLAHIAERFLSSWQPCIRGAEIWLCPDPASLPAALAEARPTWFFGVPRVWEKFGAALAPAWSAAEAAGTGGTAGPAMLARLGLDRCRVAMTGGAPIDPEVLVLFRSLGLRVSEMWGMTETGPATWNGLEDIRIGTVGKAMPGVEVSLAEDGELLVRGGNVTSGYWEDPERTAEALDAEGWMHSGDVGARDEDGYFRIIDRKKEIIITAGGKNVSPATLEGLVKRHPLVGEACVVGNRRPYPAALIVLDAPVATAWADAEGIHHDSFADLAAHPAVRAEVGRGIEAANEAVSRPERIKRFTILPAQWIAGSDELSPTLKLRRSLIEAKYGEDIDRMYA